MQSIKNVMADPEWLGAVKDEEHWVNTSKALATVGYVTQYLLPSGETVNLPKLRRRIPFFTRKSFC